MVPASISVFKPADKNFLYVKFKLNGKWVKRSTPFAPGEEAKAEAHGAKLHAEELAAANEPLTFRGWADKWLDKRKIQDVDNDRGRLANHVYPAIGDKLLEEITPQDLVEIVEALKEKELAPRTIRNVYSVVKAAYRDAQIAGVCKNDPCILKTRQLGKLRDKDLGWRAHAVYSRQEYELLLGSPLIPLDRKITYGLMGIGMMRTGEACGLLWGSVFVTKPLARISITRSYERDLTKTETERWMPIHPVLHGLLLAWKEEWAKIMGRPYGPDDLVIPCPEPENRGPRKPKGSMRDRHYIWKRLAKDLEVLGLRHRRAHDLRRTGISIGIEDGADEAILKRGSHAPPKHVMGLYTSVAWEALCREVSKIQLQPRTTLDPEKPQDLVRFRGRGPQTPRGTKGDHVSDSVNARKQKGKEWRRRESNPGPKDFPCKALRA